LYDYHSAILSGRGENSVQLLAGAEMVKRPRGHWCIFAELAKVRVGKNLCFDAKSVGCVGGRRYVGFGGELMPDFEYFLSYGVAGKVEGERYKKSPVLRSATL